MNIVEHIYLNASIVDAVIRICCVQGLDQAGEKRLHEIRSDIISTIVNNLEHNQDDLYMTEQIFTILSGLLKKCYMMMAPKALFDEMLSPFVIKPILDFTFDGNFGPNVIMGADFLTVLLYNLFISEPQHALQDVLEANFGFQVTSIAGVDVGQQSEAQAEGPSQSKEEEESKESELAEASNKIDDEKVTDEIKEDN